MRLATTLAIRRLSISATRSCQSPKSVGLALLGYVAEGVEQVAAEGHVLAFGQFDAQPVGEVVDAHPAVHQPAPPVDPDDVGLLVGVELVRQVADQCAEQVLDGQDALDAAVLVHHHGEGPALAAHLGQDVEDQA